MVVLAFYASFHTLILPSTDANAHFKISGSNFNFSLSDKVQKSANRV